MTTAPGPGSRRDAAVASLQRSRETTAAWLEGETDESAREDAWEALGLVQQALRLLGGEP